MRAVLLAICFFLAMHISAQDIHFSQFFHSPFNLNPALAGQFDGDYRFIANQRTQWRSVTTPYRTFGLSADARDFMDLEGLGTAFSLYQDRAGDSRLNTLRLNLGGSFIVPVSADSLHSVSIGLQMGMTHRNIDYSDLNFDNQYDGLAYDPNLASGESFARDSRTYFDLHLGASWFFQRNNREKYIAGFGLYNLTTPEQSFFDAAVPLNSRLNIHASAEIAIAEDWDVMPSILFMSQDNYREFVIGGSARKILLNEAGLFRTIYGGFYFRTRDAGYLLAGVDYDEWRVGLSYDFNLSDLRPASNGRGGLEIAIIYILKEFKPQLTTKRLCPEFL